MKTRTWFAAPIILLAAAGADAGAAAPQEPARMHATGTFDVTLTPQTPDNKAATPAGLSRMSLEKQFQGELEAVSYGEMLAVGDGRTAGGYVAIEKVTGALAGRRGSFALLHRALMRDGIPDGWTVAIVPGSGTGQLEGIEGTMTIRIDGKRHEYDLMYTLPG